VGYLLALLFLLVPGQSFAKEILNMHESEVPELFAESEWPELERFDIAMDQWLETQPWYMVQQAATSRIVIHVDKRKQRMTVIENGKVKFTGWKVSTGFAGRWETRSGSFTPFEMNKNYRSRMFNVILPYGIKFDGGNLIHAASTGGINYLGKKHSHGCVRLHPRNAKILFEMVRKAGMRNTRVIVQNAAYKGAPAKPAPQQTAALPEAEL